jgi:hypothetical protein
VRDRNPGHDPAAAWEDEESEADRPRFGWRVLGQIARHPKEGIALSIALAASAAVIVNALFLQSGPHPAPIFASSPKPVPAKDATGTVVTVLPRPRPAELDTPKTEVSAPPRARSDTIRSSARASPGPGRPATAGAGTAAPHNDAIAERPAASKRVLAVQRTLTEFGYGQISSTGIEDAATAAAIQKFERGHKMPVTGQISERLMREIATMTGRSVE